MILGCHVSLQAPKQYLGSVEEALSYGANAFMVYTGAPQNTIRKPLHELRIDEAKTAMKQANLSLDHVVVHAPYIVNLGNPDPEKRQFAVDFLSEEIRRTAALGSRILVLHPGAHMGDGPEEGIRRIAEGIQAILQNTSETAVSIALEGMAGKGTEVGRSFDELAALIRAIGNESRIGVCLDTCHMNDAGYDVASFDSLLETFNRIVGLSKLLVLHVNDSKNPRGASKDRHENIGFGTLGFATLHAAITHPLLSGIPKILETPYVDVPDNEKLSVAPYRHEIAMIRSGRFDPDLKVNVLADRTR